MSVLQPHFHHFQLNISFPLSHSSMTLVFPWPCTHSYFGPPAKNLTYPFPSMPFSSQNFFSSQPHTNDRCRLTLLSPDSSLSTPSTVQFAQTTSTTLSFAQRSGLMNFRLAVRPTCCLSTPQISTSSSASRASTTTGARYVASGLEAGSRGEWVPGRKSRSVSVEARCNAVRELPPELLSPLLERERRHNEPSSMRCLITGFVTLAQFLSV